LYSLFVRVDIKLRAADQTVFAQLLAYHAHRQLCAVDRDRKLLKNEGQGSDMVFMPMRQTDGFHLIAVFQQVGNVGDDEVYAGLLFVRKRDAAVDDKNGIFIVEGEHVLADVAAAAQGDDPEFRCWRSTCVSQENNPS